MVKHLLLICAVCSSAFGQAFTFRDSAWVGNLFDPTQIQGLAYYWNYSDVADGSVSTWKDRIQQTDSHQGDATKQPTKDSAGVYFNGSGFRLTNSNFTLPNAKYAIWIGLKPEVVTGGFKMIFGDKGGNTGYFNNASTLTYYFGGGHILFSDANNVSYNLVYSNDGGGGAGGGVAWTNGIAAATIVDNNATQTIGTTGSDDANEHFQGWIKFIGIWTNKTLSISDAQNLYQYGRTH